VDEVRRDRRRAIEAVRSGEFGFIRMNLAGGDMVGHTADLAATRIAVESSTWRSDGSPTPSKLRTGVWSSPPTTATPTTRSSATADGTPLRGDDGEPLLRTAHSLNPVMFAVHDFGDASVSMRDDLPDAGLANVAPTILQLLDLDIPADYEPSLLQPAGSNGATAGVAR
jgi:2,3-bisphosphoglycerate-independent phosphoglycerate mutase